MQQLGGSSIKYPFYDMFTSNVKQSFPFVQTESTVWVFSKSSNIHLYLFNILQDPRPPLFFFYIKEKLNHRSQAAQKQFKYVCPPFLVVIWRWNILNSHLVWTHLQTSTTFHLTGITWKGLCNIVTILLPHHRSNEFRKTAVQQTEGSLAVWSFFYCVIKLF